MQQRTQRVMEADERHDGDLTVVVGPIDERLLTSADEAPVQSLDDGTRPTSLAAWEIASELGSDPDPVLALGGAIAAGWDPAGDALSAVRSRARDRGVDRRPGVAIPTTDPIDGLAHSTLVSAPWSGSVEAVEEALGEIDGEQPELDDGAKPGAETGRRLASAVAIDVVADGATTASRSIARVLRPFVTPDGPFETLGGFADVLSATARLDPATGVTLAMGTDDLEPALETWRRHGRLTHGALRSATAHRYDGLFVLDVTDIGAESSTEPAFEETVDGQSTAVEVGDVTVTSVARLAAAYRSPESLVLVVDGRRAALATTVDRLPISPEAVADALDAEYDAGPRWAVFEYDETTTSDDVVDATRGAL